HAFRRLEVHAVARREIAARLCNADDGLAREQLLGREAVVHEALEIERHHVEVLGIVEPVARTEATLRGRARDHAGLCSEAARVCLLSRGRDLRRAVASRGPPSRALSRRW